MPYLSKNLRKIEYESNNSHTYTQLSLQMDGQISKYVSVLSARLIFEMSRQHQMILKSYIYTKSYLYKRNNENKQEIFTVGITHISRLIHQLQNDVSRNNRMLNTQWVSLKVFVVGRVLSMTLTSKRTRTHVIHSEWTYGQEHTFRYIGPVIVNEFVKRKSFQNKLSRFKHAQCRIVNGCIQLNER